MSGTAGAWLLNPFAGALAAIGPGELVHLHSRSTGLYPVPGALEYCRQVMLWQGRPVPVLDLGLWLDAGRVHEQRHLLAVLAFLPSGGAAPDYAGLLLDAVPRRIEVPDDAALGPDALAPAWAQIAHAAFRFQDTAVPVLDLAFIFAQGLGEHSDQAAAAGE